MPEALAGLRLQEDGTAYIDDIRSSSGNLGNIALFYATIYAYLHVRLGATEFYYLVHDLGYELATIEARVNR